MEFPAISPACSVFMNKTRLRVRTHEKLCGLRAEICVLRPTAYFAAGCSTGFSTGRSTQIAVRWPHGFYVCVRAITFMFLNTQHSGEIAGNSIALLVEIQRKLKYVQLGAACGCGLRQSINRPSVTFLHA